MRAFSGGRLLCAQRDVLSALHFRFYFRLGVHFIHSIELQRKEERPVGWGRGREMVARSAHESFAWLACLFSCLVVSEMFLP